MARPQKFRLTPDEVMEAQHARKLAGHVAEIEFFRKEVEQLQAQIAGVYDAADEDGFDKKFIRKTVARRAKNSSELEAEEAAVDAYAMAVVKGLATRTREGNPKITAAITTQNARNSEGLDPETGEFVTTSNSAQSDPSGVAADRATEATPPASVATQSQTAGQTVDQGEGDDQASGVLPDQSEPAMTADPAGSATPAASRPNSEPTTGADTGETVSTPVSPVAIAVTAGGVSIEHHGPVA
jgi:uncharacterized protein (UPF0335 family)